MLPASELHRRGRDASASGHPARARKFLRDALNRPSDHDTRARVFLTLAHVEAELGSVETGRSLCDQALALDGVSTYVRGLVHSQLGLLWMRAGDGDKAIPAFAAAEPLLDAQDEPLSRLYLNRGNVYLQRGDAARAAADFDRAIRFAERSGEALLAAKAEGNLGYARMLQGDMVAALRLIEKADRTFDTPVLQAVSRQDRAEVLIGCGMPGEATEALRAAAAAFGSRRLRQSQGEAELVLATLLLGSDAHEASKVAARARRRFDHRGSRTWATRAEAIEVISALLTARSPGSLIDRADALTRQLRVEGIAVEANRLALHTVDALAREGRHDEVLKRLTKVRLRHDSPMSERIMIREIHARVASGVGQTAQAMQHLRAGLADLHAWQSSFGSLDLQTSLVGHGRSLALSGLTLAVADGRPEAVFEWAERARALAGRVAPVRPPADEGAAQALTELRQLQAEIGAPATQGRVSAALRKRVEELRGGIRQRAWYDKGSGLVTEPETLDHVQQRLQPDEVVVSLLAVDERLHTLVTTCDSARVVRLGPLAPVRALLDGMQADLDMAATRLPAPIRMAVHGALGHRLVDLSAQLVGPWARQVRDRRVVVVPAGALAGTPWTLLPDLAGRPITVARSASEWIAQRERTWPLLSAGFVAGPGVDRAYEEVKRAAQAWGGAEVLAGGDVGSEAVRDLASRVDVFHVAAHGRHSADNPLFSGLELMDGPWFGYDIDQVASIPSTVILSACELGRSTVRWGEETIGMTAAWLHAGARCVVAAPASVDDDVACEVLAATHRRLAAGAQPADALAEALAGVHHGVAPFVCFGSGW